MFFRIKALRRKSNRFTIHMIMLIITLIVMQGIAFWFTRLWEIGQSALDADAALHAQAAAESYAARVPIQALRSDIPAPLRFVQDCVPGCTEHIHVVLSPGGFSRAVDLRDGRITQIAQHFDDVFALAYARDTDVFEYVCKHSFVELFFLQGLQRVGLGLPDLMQGGLIHPIMGFSDFSPDYPWVYFGDIFVYILLENLMHICEFSDALNARWIVLQRAGDRLPQLLLPGETHLWNPYHTAWLTNFFADSYIGGDND